MERASLMAQLVKNPPTIQETWVRFLGWKDPLEEGTGKELDMTEQLSFSHMEKGCEVEDSNVTKKKKKSSGKCLRNLRLVPHNLLFLSPSPSLPPPSF